MHRAESQIAAIRQVLAAWTFCLVAILPAVAEDPRVILKEDFESYADSDALRAVWTGGSGLLETAAPGGGKAVLHNGGELNGHGGFSILPDASHNVVFAADFYDFATNAEKRVTVALRNTSGANVEFGLLNEGGPYAARVVGLGGEPGWASFDLSQRPVRGWHRFQAIISLTNTVVTLDLGADGKVDKTLTFTGSPPVRAFVQVRIGGLPNRVSHGGPVLVDNIRLELVPVVASPTNVAAFEPSSVLRAAATNPASAAPSSSARNVTNAAPILVTPAAASPSASPLLAVAWWIAGALGVIIVLLGFLVFMFRRSGLVAGNALALTPRALLPSTSTDVAPGKDPPGDWRERALAAEALAQKQAQVLRDKMLPELTEFAKQGLVQGLYTQRNELVETQQKAQQELADLEARLAALQLPLQERIQIYEKRIGELEKELGTRGEEMRELIKATLLLVRQRLDEEKEKERTRPRLN